MTKYRYRWPVALIFFKYGFTIEWIPPIVKIEPPRPSDPEDSMLIYIGMFDDEP
jgi:hypothetical protein